MNKQKKWGEGNPVMSLGQVRPWFCWGTAWISPSRLHFNPFFSQEIVSLEETTHLDELNAADHGVCLDTDQGVRPDIQSPLLTFTELQVTDTAPAHQAVGQRAPWGSRKMTIRGGRRSCLAQLPGNGECASPHLRVPNPAGG